ncbi:4'-phosphopantetheinyl transferase superfamily protein [Bacillus ginsengihumi]|uniref:4'-phosphopantetheinyl transferase superfamily protein n=1 Tax=Heyndrickxia ginsengihumi TaxID=363870 RepID=A0A6M0P7W9_9BACI|nr:4'-phosphopantetheinyl transferase superfamily protein [Heyndrickxia ginsengihumi]MBE6183138.1 4'-phosphopantetheinyl transferase superfamily protein [Bacillus sp. (in: firmicutes)]NEY20597.1 4'-phosphopantetheinyl transferase superfamily protein [Heyndrickxia ginsengihumi]
MVSLYEPRAIPLLMNDCHVWYCSINDIQPWHLRLLSEEEQIRAKSYKKEQDRVRFILGCTISRIVLSVQLNIAPQFVPIARICPHCKHLHGKPTLTRGNIQFSVSHSEDVIVVAFIKNYKIGIDVEYIDSNIDFLTLEKSVLTEEEKMQLSHLPLRKRRSGFLTYWTRKEALLKATGEGLMTSPLNISVSSPNHPAKLLSFHNRPSLIQNSLLVDLDTRLGYIGSLAILGGETIHIKQFNGSFILKEAFTSLNM